MMRARHSALPLAVVAVLLLGGCAEAPPAPLPMAGSGFPPEPRLEPVLQYYRQLLGLPRPELDAEVERARAAFAAKPDGYNRLLLEMLVSVPDTAPAAKPRLLEALGRAESRRCPEPVTDLCVIFGALTAERIRQERYQTALREELDGRAAELDELRERLRAAQAETQKHRAAATSLKRNLADQRARAATLQRQLDELRKIERRLEERRKTTGMELPDQDGKAQGQDTPGR
jgi:hypothetical protein